MTIRCSWILLLSSLGLLILPNGCTSPLTRDLDQVLREQMATTARVYRQAVQDTATVEFSQHESRVRKGLNQQRINELEAMSGLTANATQTMDLGPDLSGADNRPAVHLTLQQAIQLAIQNNRLAKLSRLVPAANRTRLTQAEAVFDAIFFFDFNFSATDTPQPDTRLGVSRAFGAVNQNTRSLQTGIRKQLTSGGQIAASTTITRDHRSPSFFDVKTTFPTVVDLTLEQPLLRNFGQDVTRGQILLSQNALDQSMADLKQQLLDVAAGTEQAYWQLVLARESLLIRQRSRDRGKESLRQMELRADYDADSVQVSETRADVMERQLQVIQAWRAMREATDQLKQLIYADDLPISGERLIIPVDKMVDNPFSFNLLDAVTDALQQRPDLQRALSQISDATIRQRVADNQRLPLMDLSATVRYNGLSVDATHDSYDNLGEGDFIDYLMRLQVEIPIGNRQAEAQFAESKINRRGSVLNYQVVAQNAIVEVKSALRRIGADYASISTARDARLASADVVRAVRVQELAGIQLTPAFIDRKLRNEERLANNEVRETRALIDYNIAIALYYRAIGTLLTQYSIVLQEEPTE